MTTFFFFFFLANRCQSVAVLIDDLSPDVSILGLPPGSVNPRVLKLVVFIKRLSQVVFGRPAGLLQSAGGRNAAAMMWW